MSKPITDINDLEAILPDFMKASFAKCGEVNEAHERTIIGNRGALSAIYDEPEEPEVAQTIEAAPVEPIKIERGIHCQKRDELAVFKKNNEFRINLRCVGYEYHGMLNGAAAAEGAWTAYPEPQDKAFADLIFAEAVKDLRTLPASNGYNYNRCATALWSSIERTGEPVPRAFIVVFWKSIGNTQVPDTAILFDGPVTRTFKMERTEQRSVAAPLWKGWAA